MAEPDAGLIGLQRSFWSIPGASLQSGPRMPPGGRFGTFEAPARKVVPGGFQRVVLEHVRRRGSHVPVFDVSLYPSGLEELLDKRDIHGLVPAWKEPSNRMRTESLVRA